MSDHSGKAWEQGRERALHRDNYQCQDCGSKEYVHAHHIKRPEEFEVYEDGHHESNLVALCKYCHPKWEGIEARPILLDDQGANLGPVVEDLVVDHIDRLSHRMAADLIFTYFLAENPDACWYCYRPNGSYSTAPTEDWRNCIRMAVKAGFGNIEGVEMPVRRDGMGRPVDSRSSYWLCDTCSARSNYKAVTTQEFIRRCFWASEALAAQGVHHDPSRIADVGRELKETPDRTSDELGITVEAIAKAVRAVDGDERLPSWLREERYQS